MQGDKKNRAFRQRLIWVKLYENASDAGLVCRRCGISRPTLRKWWKRYQTHGPEGFESQSRRLARSPAVKVSQSEEVRIRELRETRNLGARRIQNELRRQNGLSLSLATVHKVLVRLAVKPFVTIRRKRLPRTYARPIPGDRMQMDTMKVAPGLYQYCAVDDCTRYKVLALFKRRTAVSTPIFFVPFSSE